VVDDEFSVATRKTGGDLEILLLRTDRLPWYHGMMNEIGLKVIMLREAARLYLNFGSKSTLVAEAPHEGAIVTLAGPGDTATLPM
jgi:hypothetical protein